MSQEAHRSLAEAFASSSSYRPIDSRIDLGVTLGETGQLPQSRPGFIPQKMQSVLQNLQACIRTQRSLSLWFRGQLSEVRISVAGSSASRKGPMEALNCTFGQMARYDLFRQCDGPYCRLFMSHCLRKRALSTKMASLDGAGIKGRIFESRKDFDGPDCILDMGNGVLRGVDWLLVTGCAVDARAGASGKAG